MVVIKQVIYILVFYLLAQLPAMAIWQSASMSETLKIFACVSVMCLMTVLVAENYRRKLSLSLADIGLHYPSAAGIRKHAAPVLGAAAAGFAFFALYFAVFRLLFPSAYADLLVKNGTGLLRSLLEWRQNSIAGLAALVLGQFILAVAEEFLFRGVIYNYLLRNMSWKKAVAWSSVVFAVIHLHPASLPLYFALGALFCWLYRRSGSLLVPVLCHFLYNLALVMLGEHLLAGAFK